MENCLFCRIAAGEIPSKIVHHDEHVVAFVDINPQAVTLSISNLSFDGNFTNCWTKVYIGDARNLNEIQDGSIDLIATHPPYAGIIPYSNRLIDGDLSALSVPKYIGEIKVVAKEAYRVLKPGKYCGILIGDASKHLHCVLLALL